MSPLFWYGFAAGVASVVAALMLAALVSRLFRVPATHRAGIDEDEDDPEPVLPPLRIETPTVRIQGNLYRLGRTPPPEFGEPRPLQPDERPSVGLGPPPTYPETPEEHTQ
jgi:hypothetical protein